MDFNYLNTLSVDTCKRLFNDYKESLLSESKTAKYVVDKTITWNNSPGALNVIQIRCNELFVANDKKFNNDWMITVENPSGENKYGNPKLEVYSVTVDPKIQRNNMAFVMEQITRRHIGYHKWNPARIALRQDQGSLNYRTWVARQTKKNGKWINREELGFFTIHTHDNGGFSNSSLGCTILSSLDTYKKYFKPDRK